MDANSFLAFMLRLNMSQLICPFQIPTVSKPGPELGSISVSQSKKYNRTWKKQEIEAIFSKTLKYCQDHSKRIEDLSVKDFGIIGEEFPQTAEQIMIKVNEIHQSGTLRPGIWSKEEDGLLSNLVNEDQHKWGHMAKILNSEIHSNLMIRSGKQCKERWNNYLNPLVNRGPWTLAEDVQVMKYFKEHGQKWSLISKNMKNRTEGVVKNRIKSLVNKIKQDLETKDNSEAGIDKFIRINEKKICDEGRKDEESECVDIKEEFPGV